MTTTLTECATCHRTHDPWPGAPPLVDRPVGRGLMCRVCQRHAREGL